MIFSFKNPTSPFLFRDMDLALSVYLSNQQIHSFKLSLVVPWRRSPLEYFEQLIKFAEKYLQFLISNFLDAYWMSLIDFVYLLRLRNQLNFSLKENLLVVFAKILLFF